jgi:hypothetical protein
VVLLRWQQGNTRPTGPHRNTATTMVRMATQVATAAGSRRMT